MQPMDSVRPLTEDEIAEWLKGARPDWHSARAVAMLRAEQEARQRAEAQRDRLVAALRDIEAYAHVEAYARATARIALREIEGGSDV